MTIQKKVIHEICEKPFEFCKINNRILSTIFRKFSFKTAGKVSNIDEVVDFGAVFDDVFYEYCRKEFFSNIILEGIGNIEEKLDDFIEKYGLQAETVLFLAAFQNYLGK